jgi:putative acetyltransferase
MIIRRFEPTDTEQVARLFHDTVRHVNLGDYSPAQVEAWAPDETDLAHWTQTCQSRLTLVVAVGGLILGFGELEPNGHIDRFYVHQAHQGRGVGRSLLAALELEAQRGGVFRLFTEASVTGRPFFVRMGFEIVRQQTVTCRGVAFINFLMEKTLPAASSETAPD